MSTEIIIKMDKADFDALSNTYMAFNKSWDKQIKAGRFTGLQKTSNYSVIYWFDSALALIIAKSYLTAINFSFRDLYDTHLDEYCIITNYEVREGLANAV
jgi:hypothetical protein